MTYSLLKDIGLIMNQLPDDPMPCNDVLPIITVSPLPPPPINTNDNVTSLSTLFDKMSRDAENISMFQPHSHYEDRRMFQPQSHYEDRRMFQPQVTEECENVLEQDMKCTDVFDHIKSCKVCSKLYKEDHLHCESCNQSQQQTDDGKTDYKPACIILGGVCIILFLIILKLLIRKNN